VFQEIKQRYRWVKFVFILFIILKRVGKIEDIKRIIARMSVTAEIGRVKKGIKLPSEIRSAWRRFKSNIGPSTKARTRGFLLSIDLIPPLLSL
jgi:hypothetical protein